MLRADGHEVVSRWHHGVPMGDDAYPDAEHREWRRWSESDLNDIYTADTFVAFTEPQGTRSRGGRHVEWGAALCMVKAMKDGLCIVVGPVESQFYALASHVIPDFDELRACLCTPLELPR